MKLKDYERSAADRKADKKQAKKHKMPVEQWEGFAADKRMDKAAVNNK